LLNCSAAAPAKADGENPVGHLVPVKFIIDTENGTAAVPGTGDGPIAFTEIRDVGRGVAAACALEAPWTPRTGTMAGDMLSYNAVVRLAEDITGSQSAFVTCARY
jgi:nucleoside-diphosphate-sugar epimerase